jgi:hypothetical protein
VPLMGLPARDVHLLATPNDFLDYRAVRVLGRRIASSLTV